MNYQDKFSGLRMNLPPSLIDHTRSTAQRLCGIVSKWQGVVQSQIEQGQRSVILPLDIDTDKWLDLYDIRSRLPKCYLDILNAEVQLRVVDQLRMVEIACLSAHADLLRKLQQLAFDVASLEALIDSSDSFEISAWSICKVAATANLFLLSNQLEHASQQEILAISKRSLDLQKRVSRPLVLARMVEDLIVPGDLWISDLLVRSVIRGIPDIIRNQQDDFRRQYMQQILPGLVAMLASDSLFRKLSDGPKLPEELLKHLHYDRWPGLTTIVEQSGACSLRARFSLETCQLIASGNREQCYPGLLKLISTIIQLTTSPLKERQRFIAILLLDWMSIDHNGLERFAANPHGRSILTVSVRFLESMQDPSAGDITLARVIDLRNILRQFSIYDQFRRLDEQLQSLSRPSEKVGSLGFS